MGSHSQLPEKKTAMSSLRPSPLAWLNQEWPTSTLMESQPRTGSSTSESRRTGRPTTELPVQPAEGEEVLHHPGRGLRHRSRLRDADRGDGSDPCLIPHLLTSLTRC